MLRNINTAVRATVMNSSTMITAVCLCYRQKHFHFQVPFCLMTENLHSQRSDVGKANMQFLRPLSYRHMKLLVAIYCVGP